MHAGSRTPARAWVRLPSGTRLNLLDPTPFDWTDEDLALGLARTYRWGGHSVHALPLSVAQHSLLVLALRQRAAGSVVAAQGAIQPASASGATRRKAATGQKALRGAGGPETQRQGALEQDLLGQRTAGLVLRPAGLGQDPGQQAAERGGVGADAGRGVTGPQDGAEQDTKQQAKTRQDGTEQEPGRARAGMLAAPLALRELLHDADEGLLGFDPISPLKPFLGPGYAALAGRLQGAIARRYALPDWTVAEKRTHKRADRIAAASEAVHVAGWTREEVRRTLRITEAPEDLDPLVACFGEPPWVPWPADQAAERFLAALRRFNGAG